MVFLYRKYIGVIEMIVEKIMLLLYMVIYWELYYVNGYDEYEFYIE